jgi:hypothetical protein
MNIAHIRFNATSQKGEVAWFLTVIAMLTVALGLIVGINTTTSEQALTRSSEAVGGGMYKGKPVDRTDGQFIATGKTCGAEFHTQIDPRIIDIIIARPPSKDWPSATAQTFALVDDGGATGIRGLVFVKNYSFIVRFDPNDPHKTTPNPRDILVTYKVPSQPDQRFIVDQSKVPDWVQNSDTEVYLVWSYTKVSASKYFFTSATSRGCPGPGTPTPTLLTPTVTPTGTLTPTISVTPTITPTPGEGACYDICSRSAECGRHEDPATGVDQQMLCLETQRTGGSLALADQGRSVNFTLQSGDESVDEFPFFADAILADLDKNGAAADWIKVKPASWRNSDDVTGPFRRGNEPESSDIAAFKWDTDNVPVNVQNRTFSITVENLPPQYEIVSKFCTDDAFGAHRPDACGNFDANNGPGTRLDTVYGIKVLKDAMIFYGWNIRLKRAPTSAPTSPPQATRVPTATAVPTARPTTTPAPTPSVCDAIIGKVPEAVITNALSNPASIPGWGQAQDPSRPVSPTNPIRNKLTMINVAQPYHPTFNSVIFRAVCPATPTTAPTVPPTAGPTAVPTTAPTVTPAPGGHAVCDPTKGVECRCMPPSCTGRDCSTKALACERQPTVTPTQSPTPTTGLAQCIFNVISFVEECKEINPTTGECMPILGTNRLNATPLSDDIVSKTDPIWRRWATMNNRQTVNPRRPDEEKPPKPNVFNKIEISETGFADLLRIFPLFNFANNRSEGITLTPRVKSVQDVTVTDPRELLRPRTDIKIATEDEIRRNIKPTDDITVYVPAEQHNNMEDASARIFFDTNNYRIVPNGKNIYTCTNAIAQQLQADGKLDPTADASIINMTTGTGACNIGEFNKNTDRDTIAGLTVGCGQDIVYGWTLQKCTFNYDYVFVVDTSTTMGMADPNLGGQRKIDAVMDQLDIFVSAIERSGSDSRIALVNFNNAVHVYENGTGRIKDDDGDGYGNGIRTRGLVDRSQFGAVRAQFPQFRKMKAEGGLIEKGSCQRCGLDLAKQILQDKRSDDEKKARAGIVVFLSDGLPNSYAGDADPDVMAQYPPEARNNVEPWGWAGIYNSADALRNDGTTTPSEGVSIPGRNASVFDDVLLATISYGDSSKRTNEGQDFRQFSYSVASERASGLGRWAYSTDPDDAAPISISEIFSQVQRDLNTCALSTLAYDISLKARDINKDGIVNTIDLFLIYDKYYAKGEDIPEDVNADGVVNALDVSLVLQSSGTIVSRVDATPTPLAN